MFFFTVGSYLLIGWEAGPGAIDSDTTSLILAWRMIRDGQILDPWVLATPKFLPVVLDGALFDIGGFPAVWLRSVLSAALMVSAGAAFVYSIAGGWAATLAAAFLLLNSVLLTLTMGGNSTILAVGFVTASLLAFRNHESARSRRAGSGLLFAAALSRGEMLVFLVLAGALFAWLAWRKRSRSWLLSAAAAALLAGGALLLDLFVPTKLSGRWKDSRAVALELADAIGRQVEADERYGVQPDYRLRHHHQLADSYASNLYGLFRRMLRPLPLFVITGLAGIAFLLRHTPSLGFPLALMAGAPLVYGWLIFLQGAGLFDRFFLPAVVAFLIASPLAYWAVWQSLRRQPDSLRAKLGQPLLILLALAAVAVGARDVYNQRRGYLRSVSTDLLQFRQGIEPLLGADMRSKRVLLHGWHYGYANLVLQTDPNKVRHDDDLPSAESPRDHLCSFDYYFYRKGSPLTDETLRVISSGGSIPCMEPLWDSPDGSYRFYRRSQNLPRPD